MTQNPVTIDVQSSAGDAVKLLQDLDIRHLPVLDGSTLVGMLSDRDLKQILLPDSLENETIETIKGRFDTPVAKLMSSDVVKAFPHSGIGELIELMLEFKIGAVPVVDATVGDVKGIVSYVDVLRVAQDELDG